MVKSRTHSRSVVIFAPVTCVLCLCLWLGGCQGLPGAAPPLVEATLDTPFALSMGQTARLPAAGLDITFVAVPADGRCPLNIECEASLPVRVALQIQPVAADENQSPQDLELSAHTRRDGTVTPDAPGDSHTGRYQSYLITLLSVTPYPDVERPTRAADYGVILRVSEAPAIPEETETPIAAGPRLGQEFTLMREESARLADVELQVTFDEVVEDSRCPADVSCVWAGVVKVALTAVTPDEPAQRFVVGGITNQEGDVVPETPAADGAPASWWVAGYTITLRQVTPYPAQAQQPTPPAAYQVTLVVTQSPDGPPAAQLSSPEEPAFPVDLEGLPTLCMSERALVEQLAGVEGAAPLQLTPPVAAASLTDPDAATALCVHQFGDEFHVATRDALGSLWQDFLPADGNYWLWDGETGAFVAAP